MTLDQLARADAAVATKVTARQAMARITRTIATLNAEHLAAKTAELAADQELYEILKAAG